MSAAGETLRDVLLLVFDRATEYARKRWLDAGIIAEPEDVSVTRADVEQAIIALRFEQMELTSRQLDAMRELHELRMRDIEQRAREQGQGMDVEVVEPNPAPSDFRPVFTPRKR